MRRSVTIACLVVLHASGVFAQTTPTTRLIPYSGVAADGGGAPVRGTVTLIFELFEEHDAGAPLWQETQHAQVDNRGRYGVYLGAVTPIPQIVFGEERARWLAVTIDGRAQPRVMLVAVPYALRAADADTLGGRPASAFVRARADGKLETSAGLVSEAAVEGTGDTNSLAKFSSPTTVTSATIAEVGGRVGFGLADPTGGGVVDSVFSIRNFDNNTGFAILNETQQRRFAINTSSNGGWTMYDGGSGIWNQGLTQLNGNVGLGTTGPDARLRVFGNANNDAIFGTATSTLRKAVRGNAPNGGVGLLGIISDMPGTDVPPLNAGVVGFNTHGGAGVRAQNNTGTLLNAALAASSVSGTAVYGTSTSGLAGDFGGNVGISGNLGIGVGPGSSHLSVVKTDDSSSAAGLFTVNNAVTTGAAVRGTTNTASTGIGGAAGINGVATGTGGFAGYFQVSNAAHTPAAVVITNAGIGTSLAVVGAAPTTIATDIRHFGNGDALVATADDSGMGRAARFTNENTANTNEVVSIVQSGTGTGLRINHAGASGNLATFLSASVNVARIDKTGKGFFNGGTQTGGADVAESFDVDGDARAYEPGDVLEISADHDRRLRKSAEAYSTRVIGVYATKPGVLLSDLSIDADQGNRIPAGIVGVIPTKVSAENGAIRRGDLLVTAGTPGHAMKAGAPPPIGSVIGKALADFSGPGTGVIEVLVNVR